MTSGFFRRPSWRSLTAVVVAVSTVFLLSTLDFRNVFEPLPTTSDGLNSIANDLDFASGFSDAEYDSGLYKRTDICNTTFPGRYSQTCSPSETLCCIIPNASKPACTVILGYGFCCTEHIDCFVDLPSQCGQSNSVTCSPNPGACCPQYTTCVPDFNQTSSLVRCYVERSLIPGYTASSSSSSASSTSSSTSISSSIATAASATVAPTSSPSTTSSISNDKSSSLSKGTIAGIVIAVIAALGLMVLGGLFLYRYATWPSQQPYDRAAYDMAPQHAPTGYQGYGGSPHQYYDPPGSKPVYPLGEMPDDHAVGELPSHHNFNPRELSG